MNARTAVVVAVFEHEQCISIQANKTKQKRDTSTDDASPTREAKDTTDREAPGRDEQQHHIKEPQ